MPDFLFEASGEAEVADDEVGLTQGIEALFGDGCREDGEGFERGFCAALGDDAVDVIPPIGEGGRCGSRWLLEMGDSLRARTLR